MCCGRNNLAGVSLNQLQGTNFYLSSHKFSSPALYSVIYSTNNLFFLLFSWTPPPSLTHTCTWVGGGQKLSHMHTDACICMNTDNTHERLHIQPQDKKSDFGILSDVVHLFLTNINAFQFVNVVVAH
jgi:hypothetical protein